MREITNILFENLFDNEKYVQVVFPYLKPDYFDTPAEQALFTVMQEFSDKYGSIPNRDAALVEVEEKITTLDEFEEVKDLLATSDIQDDLTWLVDTTEKWVKDKALDIAFRKSIQIAQDEGKYDSRGEIPELMKEALSIAFTIDAGYVYSESTEAQYEFYHTLADKFPLDIKLLNYYMDGGPERGTLNLLMGPSGSGKSMWLCHFAASYISSGRKVAYITMEMSEQKIAERIDSNLLDMEIADIKKFSKDKYEKLIGKAKNMTKGDLVIKQFPTASANANHIRYYLKELREKKGFVPDIVIIDYLNICASTRLKLGGNVNTYSYIKFIAEELRGLAVEMDIPIWSATQTNRGGINASDLSESDVSESYGIVMTVDFFAGLITNEDLEEMDQQILKVLKNRYGPLGSFPVTINRAKMKLYNIEKDTFSDSDVPITSHDKPKQDKYEGIQF